MAKYTLLTGATGLVGRYLLRDLLTAGHRLAVVVRPSPKLSPATRVEQVLQRWERQAGRRLPRPVCLSGDVTQPALGLSEADRVWISRRCVRVIHNAALLTFFGHDRQGEPWRTNVEGTRHVLGLLEQTGVRDLHYVSTAYVCGCREGTIREDEFDCGQGFRNDYEHSKFLAEKLVRQAGFLEQTTVYRPAVIAGDSETGYTNTYHGLYLYLKLMSVLVRNETPGPDGVRNTPLRLSMTGDEPRNVVPVDWISQVMCRLLETPQAWGGTYHLAPQAPITPRQVIDAGYKYFNSRGVEFCGPDSVSDQGLSQFERAAYENKTIYEPYETSDPEFDTTNLLRFTSDLPCPEIDEAMLHRFWRYGEEDRWGKRREPVPQVSFWMPEYLERLAAELPNGRQLSPATGSLRPFGLDVLGPGGGQWTLYCRASQLHSVTAGLPGVPATVFRISANAIAAVVQGGTAPTPEYLRQHTRCVGSPCDADWSQMLSRLLFPPQAVSARPQRAAS